MLSTHDDIKFNKKLWEEFLVRFIIDNNIVNNNQYYRKQIIKQCSMFDSRPFYVCTEDNNKEYEFTDNFRVDAIIYEIGRYNRYTFIMY